MDLAERRQIHQMKVDRSIDALNFPIIERIVGYKRIVDGGVIDPKSIGINRGSPCERRGTTRRKTLRAKAKQLIVTLASGKVPLPVLEMRIKKCENCLHCTRVKDKIFCECCGCPKWRLADLKHKNQYVGHYCPIGEFGVYEG